MHHPAVGALELSFENLRIPGSARQRIIACTPVPGSPSEASLPLLGSLTAATDPATTGARP
nr:hypothetical protein [Streptomyces brasiliensis]